MNKRILTETLAIEQNKLLYFMPIERMYLSARLKNTFMRYYGHYFGDLCTLQSDFKHSGSRGFQCVGEKTTAEMKRFIKKYKAELDTMEEVYGWHPDDINRIVQKYFPSLLSLKKCVELIKEKKYPPCDDIGWLIPIAWIPFPKYVLKQIKRDFPDAVYAGDIDRNICFLKNFGIYPPRRYNPEQNKMVAVKWRPANVLKVSRSYFPSKEIFTDRLKEFDVKRAILE